MRALQYVFWWHQVWSPAMCSSGGYLWKRFWNCKWSRTLRSSIPRILCLRQEVGNMANGPDPTHQLKSSVPPPNLACIGSAWEAKNPAKVTTCQMGNGRAAPLSLAESLCCCAVQGLWKPRWVCPPFFIQHMANLAGGFMYQAELCTGCFHVVHNLDLSGEMMTSPSIVQPLFWKRLATPAIEATLRGSQFLAGTK